MEIMDQHSYFHARESFFYPGIHNRDQNRTLFCWLPTNAGLNQMHNGFQHWSMNK